MDFLNFAKSFEHFLGRQRLAGKEGAQSEKVQKIGI